MWVQAQGTYPWGCESENIVELDAMQSSEMVPALKKSTIFSFKVTFIISSQGITKKAVKSNRISSCTDIGNYVKNSFHNASLEKA